VHRRGVELKEATVGQGGGQCWHGARKKQRRGVSGRRRSKRGSSSAGRSPYSRTRWWKWCAVNTVGGEAAAVVSWARGRRRPLFEGGGAVRTRSAHGSDRAADGRVPTVFIYSQNIQNSSNMEIEK
jgi:hypothetical protein